jgi:hypothetical protein
MTLRQHSLAVASAVVAAVSIALAASAAAAADPAGCVPLDGTQLDAHASETNKLGIFYDLDVTYWYQDGAVNYRKDVNGPFGSHSTGKHRDYPRQLRDPPPRDRLQQMT